ncbi:MAG: tetratricopeptide repeat protein [Verrucomicrobiae bacterium]|nr:tetratricopeptide repeat protein [Verrucomicrobiae bacterium]
MALHGRRWLWLGGIFCLGVFLRGQEPTPEALEEEAKTLGSRADLTVVGARGLTVRGTNLEGDGVRRPRMLLARAAELYAERAIQTGDYNFFSQRDKALAIWDDLQDCRTPVGYLRMFKQQHGRTKPSLAAACDYEIARCYEEQGDLESVRTICKAYATVSCDDEYTGRCKALYAMDLLQERNYKDAAAIAEEVRAKCPPRDVYREKMDAAAMAVRVLSLIPAEARGKTVRSDQSDEAELLAGVKENPRKYLRLGQLAERRGDKTKAAEYYAEFRRNFPTDETSFNLGLKLARMCVEIKQASKALETYQSVWVSNPNLPQSATARIEAAALIMQTGKPEGAVKLLREGITQATAAGAKATLMAALAEQHLTARRMDDAAAIYIQLMSSYGEQNAAKGAIDKLKAVAPKVKNWQGMTQQIQTWATGGKNRPGYGIHELTPQAVSDLRRLALMFYIQNGEYRGALSWLQQCGAKSRSEDMSFIVLDEAWLYGETLRHAMSPAGRTKLRPADYPTLMDLGLRGWNIARSGREGWDCLKTTADFVKMLKPKSDRVKKLCDELKALRGTAYEQDAQDLLVDTLTAIGEKKEAEKARQGQ